MSRLSAPSISGSPLFPVAGQLVCWCGVALKHWHAFSLTPALSRWERAGVRENGHPTSSVNESLNPLETSKNPKEALRLSSVVPRSLSEFVRYSTEVSRYVNQVA